METSRVSNVQYVENEQVMRSRAVEQVVRGVPTSDGAGVKLTRVLSQSLQARLDPFLMLDAFGSDQPDEYLAGFPDHPHRGFETVTYMLAGRLLHRDSAGHEGLLEAGGVQWMTAGRGVIHSEIPQQQAGLMQGFQLWLNLPARDKMCAPWYRDFPADALPVLRTASGVQAVVIAGESHGVRGAVCREVTQPLYLDLHLPAGSRFAQPLPASHNAFVYVQAGAVSIGERETSFGRMVILDNDPESQGVVIRNESDETARVLLIAGAPLGERIVQYGPFVMNSEQEIYQAISDYRNGKLVA